MKKERAKGKPKQAGDAGVPMWLDAIGGRWAVLVGTRLLFVVVVAAGSVGGLLLLVTLLVGLGLGIVRLLLLVVEGLPLLAELLADLAELDTGVVLADLVTLLVGEEHVGGKTTLGLVGVLLFAALTLGGTLGAGGGGGGLLLRHGDGVSWKFGVERGIRMR